MSDLDRVRRWAEALIVQHLDPSWTFAFDHAKVRAGLCDFTRKRITVSRYLAARFDDEENYQTLLHEVAHALAGPKEGHNPRWLGIARELGYIGGVRHTGETARELAAWVGVCPAGHTIYRHRKPSRASSCTRCSPVYNEAHRIGWMRREITPSMRKAAMKPREEVAAAMPPREDAYFGADALF